MARGRRSDNSKRNMAALATAGGGYEVATCYVHKDRSVICSETNGVKSNEGGN
jgi:hypothetical protein